MAGRRARCFGCQQPEFSFSENLLDLQCGHMYCELCLTTVQGYSSSSVCPACGDLSNVSEKQLLYPVNKWLDDQQTRWSPKQPFHGRNASCPIPNTGHLKAGNSQKHLLNCDETDFPISYQKIVHDCKSFHPLNSPKKIKRNAKNNELDRLLNIEVEPVSDASTLKSAQKRFDASTEEDMLQVVEDALSMGSYSFDKLNDVLQTLDQLHAQKKQEEKKIEQFMNDEFSKISVALQKRKGMMHQELTTDADRLYAEIEDAKKMIKKKLDYLKGAMQLARGLKEIPSSRTYCDVHQIISCLKSPVKNDCSVVDKLKSSTTFSRFVMNIEEIISALQEIDFESIRGPHPGGNGDVEQTIQVPCSQTESSSWDTYLSLDVFGSSMKQLYTKASNQEESCAVHSQVKESKPNDTSLTLLKKGANILPSTSSPDVIIEEVIDDDEESCLSDHITEPPKEVKKTANTMCSIREQKSSDQELVFVTHVLNPCNFYIQRYSEKKTANELEQQITVYCSTRSPPNLNDVLVLGENIFVKSKEHSKWCRATITELIPLESKNEGKPCGPTKYEISNISVMKVFLQDFGSTEVLLILGFGCLYSMTLEHLNLHHSVLKDLCPYVRKIDPNMEDKMNSVVALAVQCALKDIVPQDMMCGWGEEVKEEFLRMVCNKAVLMKVFKEEHRKLIVDLKKPGTNKITSDMPVSLRDALVFTELARFRSNDSSTSLQGLSVSSYAPASSPKAMASVPVVVCYVNSPTDFYIQMMDTLDYMYIGKKIQEVYSNEDEDSLEIICPVKGQPCIAMFENEWYRAEVISLPGNREVEVKYVDFGNIAKVNVKQLRKIKDEFLSLPQKAIWCQLAYIEPLMKNAEWSEDAVGKFQLLVCDKILACSVVGILEDGKLSVQLYDPKPLPGKRTSSINSSLVEDNLALFISGESSSKKIEEVWDPEPESMFCESEYDSTCFEYDLDFSSLKIKEELPVRVCHVESPAKVFVRWLSSESQLKRFQNELYDAYQTSKPEKIEWCMDMNCAVEQPILKQWYRGKVKQVVSETYVKVFYFDYGNHELVNVSRLRMLKEDIRKLVPLALAISLKDIRPTGGSEKWTATACDCLSLYLKGSVASLILEENCSKQPLSVKLFKNEGGQLVDVSNFLVTKGLAFKERRSELITEVNRIHTDIIEKDALDSSSVLSEANCSSNPEDLSVLDRPCVVEKPLVISKGSTEPYKPLCILSENRFQAEVSSIGDDGTVYVVQKSLKKELEKLMEHMQNDLKCLGILEPYGWKKGEGCSIRGSDTMWYRGKVIDVVGGSIRVYYVDYGYIEKIPECHLCPSVLYPEVPQFAIPCELNKILPVGRSWQPDAVELLKEFLMKRCVDVHPRGHSEGPDGRIPVSLYCEGISLSHFMEHHKHCFTEDSQNRTAVETMHVSDEDLLNHWSNKYQDLLLPEYEAPLLARYVLPILPYPGKQFPVTARHVETPNELFVCLEPKDSMNQLSDTDDSGLSCESEMDTFELDLRRCSQGIETLPPLKDFRSEMPCLATYTDGQLYRAKFLSIEQYDPVSIMVQYVDYGSSVVLPTGSLFEIPATLMQYPARAIKVKLAGFKPPLDDGETERIPYRTDWSMAALWEIMYCLNKKELLASTVARSPEPTVFLYKDDGTPVHMALVEKGLADLDD